MEINQRISKILEYSKLTASEFADEIEVPRSSISHITSGRNKPSLEFIVKVKNRFPELQWDWMIRGNGEMLQEKHEGESVPGKSAPAQDLFSIIEDENFGKPENFRPVFPNPRESAVSDNTKPLAQTDNPQPLAKDKTDKVATPTHQEKIKRIVMFFESGRFESYEP